MLRILINLPIKRLVWTGHWSRPVLEFSKWQRTADWTAVVVLCGPMISGPVRSYDFRSWLVRVQSSPSLFPVLGLGFQTLGIQNMDEGIHLLTLDDFRVKALKQVHLFYSQGSARQAIYKKSTLKFYFKHIPHEKYREFKCITCLLYKHIQWSCL